MPRYFFDIHNGPSFARDDIGTECDGYEGFRSEPMRALPSIERDEIPKDGDRQAFTVPVRNRDDITVYSAMLTFAGLWIGDVPMPKPEEPLT